MLVENKRVKARLRQDELFPGMELQDVCVHVRGIIRGSVEIYPIPDWGAVADMLDERLKTWEPNLYEDDSLAAPGTSNWHDWAMDRQIKELVRQTVEYLRAYMRELSGISG